MLVTPTIIDKDLIRMRIRPEYSELSGQQSGGVPGLSTRRVDTTVQLREGQTIVLAGLLSYRARTEVAGLPFLGGLPLVVTYLVAAGGLAAALSTADGLLLTISNALSHDFFFRVVRPNASAIKRVMFSKLMVLVTAVLAAWVASLSWRTRQ